MMRLPLTLSLYIGKHTLTRVLLALGAMMLIVGLVDTVELIRRGSGKDNVPLHIIFEMAILKWPKMSEKILPFAVLIGGMFSLTRLTRTNELVVARAAGISVWQFLFPAVAAVLLISLASIVVMNPLSSAMAQRFDQLENKYLKGRTSLLAVSSSGLWLRQTEESDPLIHERIIHALRASQKDMHLSEVTVFSFGQDYRFIERLDAEEGQLAGGKWQFRNATISRPGMLPEMHAEYDFRTDLTIEQLQDSFASVKTMSFWEISGFIKTLEKAGFSAMRHKLYWHSVLASPLLLCAMLLIAATFSLRLPRRGGVAILVVAGVITGFLVRFMIDLVSALGLSGNVPVALSAWTPSCICLMIGVALLLHLEDG